MAASKSFVFRFDDVEVWEREFTLIKAGKVLTVEPKAFRALLFLVHNPQRLISKEELLSTVWGNAAVTDGSLTRCIWLLRSLLGDDIRDPRYIATVATVGYRFVCKVEVTEDDSGTLEAAGKPNGFDGNDRVEEHANLGILGAAAPTPAEAGNVADGENRNGKSTEESREGFWRWLVSVPAVMVLLALGAGSYFYFHRTPKLTDKDTIVLADFTNRTEDAVFDGTLREGLSVQLEQSPFLNIISDQQSRQTLQMMGQNPDAKITPQIARELCQRTGSAAVVNGSIAEIGTRYLLTLKAVSCMSGESLASAEAQAIDKNNVLDALGKTASEIRRKLGESLSTVQKFNTPLVQATTPSLEALEAYTMGEKLAFGQGEHAAAVPFYQRAIMLDHNFATAYQSLSIVYIVLGETSLSIENIKKAYELRQSVSEGEKSDIETFYYDIVTEDIEKLRQEDELLAQTYPRLSRNNLGLVYQALGQYDRSLLEFRESLPLDPEESVSYFNLVRAYFVVGRLREAQETFDQAEAKHLDSLWLRVFRYDLAFLENDATGMQQQVTWSLDKPGFEDMFLNLEADTAGYSGHAREARELSRQAVEFAGRAELSGRAADHEVNAAMRESLFGNFAEAQRQAKASLNRSPGPFVQYKAAIALALGRDVVGAENLANEMRRRYPENLRVRRQRIPTIQALVALDRNQTANAIEVAESIPTEVVESSPYQEADFFPVYVRGEAYLAAHRGAEARAEFQKIVDNRGIIVNQPIGALAHLQIGRAYATQGDVTKAKAAYHDFLTLWKDADPDIPILKEAKAEYAKLQ
jgi:DNA-binding winged helix-turn-helix (wHTH) protein/tetratricopeptide (TPR) repeat protein